MKISKISAKTYTGKKVKPSVTVKVGDTTLKNGTDYTLSYSGNTEPGTATVTVAGKGRYDFAADVSFSIVLKAPTVKVTSSGSKKVLKWKAVLCPDKRWYKKDNSGMWYGYTGTEPDKYEIYCSVDGKDYSLLDTVSGKAVSYTAKKLEAGKTYKFKVRACVTELKNGAELSYKSPFSSAVSVKK